MLNTHYFTDPLDPAFRRVCETAHVATTEGDNCTRTELIRRVHQNFARAMFPKAMEATELAHDQQLMERDRQHIRVGFVSADLVEHAVSRFAGVFLQHYDKGAMEVFLYSNAIYNKDKIEELRCDTYRCILNANAEECARQIREDGIDILIDLSGHSSGNRLDIFALRPAKVCLSFIGYPADVGFPFMKRISDEYTERFDTVQDGQQPILLATTFLRHIAPDDETVEPARRPGERAIVFGCFAKLQKINADVITAWTAILQRLPEARLLLKSRYFECPEVVKTWRAKFGEIGNRVVLLKGQNSHKEHMTSFRMLDVYLGTFPYTDTTLACDALQQGVPLITLAPAVMGTGHVERVSGSILNQMGRSEWVASTVQEYIDIAEMTARRIVAQDDVTETIREDFLAKMVHSGPEYVRSLEKTFIELLE